jgi:16S rRNA (cytosine1402-N4)-methyltransferase
MQGGKVQESDRLHRSILVGECLEALGVARGGTFLDLTFGEGGHSEAMLKAGADRVIAFDQDAETLARYREKGALKDDPRLTLVHSRFSEVGAYVPADSVQGVLIDLGVSTRQLLLAERGFSFRDGGPLDMRMDPTRGMPLSSWLEKLSASELAEHLSRNTDMKGAFGAAKRIVNAFHDGRLKTTADLGALFDRPGTKVHAGTVVFLGLRMMVNDELGETEAVIPQVMDALKVGGRFAVITFHSTEDRLVKRATKILAGQCICEKPICRCPRVKRAELILRKPLSPSEDELRSNPRARSAKLRCIEKVS